MDASIHGWQLDPVQTTWVDSLCLVDNVRRKVAAEKINGNRVLCLSVLVVVRCWEWRVPEISANFHSHLKTDNLQWSL